jgi:hypothetical protein
VYDDILDLGTLAVYRRASAEPSLADECRLARARLARILAQNDEDLVASRFDMLIKLALAQAKIGAAPISLAITAEE